MKYPKDTYCDLVEVGENSWSFGRIDIDVLNAGGVNLEEYVGGFIEKRSKEPYNWIFGPRQQTEVNDKKAIGLSYRFGGLKRLAEATFVKQGENIYVLSWSAGGFVCNEPEIFSQILATFRFVEPIFTVKVAVIALDDRGKSGKEIGCGDSVVYITRTSSSTAGPLHAAFEQLFALGSLYIKDPALKHLWLVSGDGTEYGLYNIIHKQQVPGGLEFDHAVIEDGIAKIYLNGAFGSFGGICDEPRLPAQIEGTAEQFPVVESVEIYINGHLN